jgi:hypothetical protein
MRQRLPIGAARHKRVEALAEDLWAAVSGERQKAGIGKDNRVVRFLCVREHHRHSCRFRGNDKRTERLAEAFDFGFGDFLFIGLVRHVRHSGSESLEGDIRVSIRGA